MMTCPICQAVMKPSSMEMHERYHRQVEKSKELEKELEKKEKETMIVSAQTGKPRRKAAEKAVPKILEFSQSLRDKNEKRQLVAKKIKLDFSSLEDVIQMPNGEKKIPVVWKRIWKKELASKGVMSCRQIGCTYTCSSFETICEHFYQCKFTPQESFVCKMCKFFADSKDKIMAHVKEVHCNENLELNEHSGYQSDFEMDEESTSSSDESLIESSSFRKQKNRLRKMARMSSYPNICDKMAFLHKQPVQKPSRIYMPALHWSLAFEQKNYELASFKDYVPNPFTLLKNDDAAKYIPELTISMSVKRVNVGLSKNTEHSDTGGQFADWKQFARFEADVHEAVPTFFVGGPVWALAWSPIPSPMYTKNPIQYVAVSTHPTMESEYTIGKGYTGRNIIQVWDVGSLDHGSDSVNRTPTLAYAIAHNNGTVWCLEWCPSGCYEHIDLCKYKAEQNQPRRMGLLAAACSDGCVNIYSLPFADELKFEKTEYNSWPIYKTDPVITLVVNFAMYKNNEQNWQATKLSWTKERGHNIIAAGFTNGYIALWNLTSTSPFVLNVQENTKYLNAFKHFFAHHNPVTMVAIVPYHGSRYLASASTDRTYKFWDLEDTSAPQNCTKKGIITDGVWMTHWPCAVLSFDDALGYKHTNSCLITLREMGYKYCPLLPTSSPTYAIAASDHSNGITHGTLTGEVITIFPHEMLYLDKILSKKKLLNSFIETVDFSREQHNNSSKNSEDKTEEGSKDYNYMPEKYDECKDRFGMIFYDDLTKPRETFTKEGKRQSTVLLEKLKRTHIEQYPFTSANKVAWNPNAWSYLWLAVGYQNGLVRLLNLRVMFPEQAVLNDILSSHAKSVHTAAQ
ncbi:general transcription factor 3C polypeptide 2 isoform X2 [Ooceraea biroi]|nr:general transcription factor 3C polypeptide 2 isoform X2 [Ooceraea biroi]